MTAVAELLEDLEEHRLVDALATLGPRDAIVGDRAFAATLPALLPADAAAPLVPLPTALDGAAEAAGRTVVCTLGDEAGCVARLRADDHRTVLGLLGDVLPRCAAGVSIDAERARARRGYAILCLPRTGSYHLCGLLAGAGLGRPDEHLDSGICRVARRGLVDVRAHLDAVAAVAGAGGWFGTKLIAPVLFEAFESGLPPNAFVDWLQEHRLRVVHLHRRDRVARAVSFAAALRTGVWDLRGGGRRPDPPAYDFDAIRSAFDDLRAQERWLDQLLGLLPEPPLRIDYEELDARPAAVLAEVVGFLTGEVVEPGRLRVQPRTRKLRDRRAIEHARRFAAELRAHGVDPDA